MRPPEFWKADARGRDSALALRAALTPLAWAYAWAGARRYATVRPHHASIPVVCVGNLTVGGAGKTPLARAVRKRLGPHAHTLSRGYGGRIAGPLRVTPDMDAREVGDEPLLHARDGPAWIARDRVAGARAAANAGAHVIVMDDGYQNPTLAKDLSVLAFDTGYGVGNGQVFPAGPLREPVARGLARADAIVLIGDIQGEPPDWLPPSYTRPILHARLTPTAELPDAPLLAFAGLARPEKFFDTLRDAGGQLEDAIPFPDHHQFEADDLELLWKMATERGARLITTEKDAARLPEDWRARVAVLPVEAQFADEAALEALLAPVRQRMAGPHG